MDVILYAAVEEKAELAREHAAPFMPMFWKTIFWTPFAANCQNSKIYPAKIWDDVTFEDRQAIVDIFIQTIKIANGTIEIIWKI